MKHSINLKKIKEKIEKQGQKYKVAPEMKLK